MKTLATRLLAKSAPAEAAECAEGLTLVGHLSATSTAARELSACSLDDQLKALGLPADPWRERAGRVLVAAAVWHDLGKANEHFLRMLDGSPLPQGIRHEWISLLLARDPTCEAWLRSAFASDEEWHAFQWAVCGHHRRPWPDTVSGAGPCLKVLSAHRDFAECLSHVAQCLGLVSPPVLPADIDLRLVGSTGVQARFAKLRREAGAMFDTMPTGWKKLTALVKASLIGADVAASSVAGDGDPSVAWIGDSLAQCPRPEELEQVVASRLKGAEPRTFQVQVAEIPGRVVLVQAGCGTGKTAAAYLRSARNPLWLGRRIYFCYPTTGTATEGFRDYLFDGDRSLAGAKLFHGRAGIDRRVILGQADDPDVENLVRTESLTAWDTPVVACTVDTVLGLLQNHRRGVYAWPALARSAFVFDEIHAYDDRLFGSLLKFIGWLPGLPVLLMSASLPTARLAALRRVTDRLGESLGLVAGPAEIESIARYQRSELPPALSPDAKILRVCNTVDRAMTAASDGLLSGSPTIYHSRFKYRDRVERHREVVEGFGSAGPTCAVTTQVCEMSLDLSADLLVTELAPVPALIQRLGRLNRRTPREPKPFVIIDPPRPEPYTQAELDNARVWLLRLGSGPLSQSDLVRAWLEQEGPPADFPDHSAWLDGGPDSTPLELRDGSRNITILMEEDLSAAKVRPRRIGEFLLPMPYRKEIDAWPRHRGIPVAPAGTILYNPNTGATWQPN